MPIEKIRILHLEDSESDAEHVHRLLKKGGINCTVQIVDTRADYVLALKQFEPDIVLSDHTMPSFNSLEALDLLRTSGLEIPFVLVTGTVSEEFAANIMMKGADDYILKDRPQRLSVSILATLEKYNLKRSREKSEIHLRNIFEGSSDVLCSIDAEGRFVEVSSAAERIWGYKPAELIGRKYSDLVFESDLYITNQVAKGVMQGLAVTNFDNHYMHKNGTKIPMNWSARWDAHAEIMYAVARDGTEKVKAEKAMRTERKRLMDLFTNAPVNMCMLAGEDHVFEMVNRVSEKQIMRNVKGKKYKDAFPESEQQGFTKLLDKVFKTGEPFEAKEMLVKVDQNKDGILVDNYLDILLQPYRDSEGQIEGVCYFGAHVTGQVLARKKIEESEANLTAIIENADAHIYSLNRDLCYITFNSVIKESMLTSYGLEIKPGDNVYSFLEKINPEEAKWWERIYTKALAGNTLRFVKDYSRPGHPSYLNFSINPILENESIIGLSCFARDITEKKLGEIEMAQLNNRFLLATTSAGMGIWDWDIPGKKLTWDDGMYKLYGIERGQFTTGYSAWLNMLHPDDRINSHNAIQMAIEGKKEYETEFRIICLDSSIRYIKATGTIERDELGNALQMIGANWDITQSKEAEIVVQKMNETLEQRVQERTAALSDANKELEAFTGTVSHDLRAPARAVTKFAEIIRTDYGDKMEPKEKELFKFVEESGNRMLAIIEDLLKLVKYGNEMLKPEPVDMTRLVQGIWLNISRLETHRAELDLQALGTANVDMSMIQQVVVNLLSNAIKYSSKKDKPLVTVWCERQEDNVTFYFKDNGAGFDMKNYYRLFGVFQRFHSVREFAGTGVGLSLVKRIIEKHNGTVGAEAKVGEGATFYFTLPVS